MSLCRRGEQILAEEKEKYLQRSKNKYSQKRNWKCTFGEIEIMAEKCCNDKKMI